MRHVNRSTPPKSGPCLLVRAANQCFGCCLGTRNAGTNARVLRNCHLGSTLSTDTQRLGFRCNQLFVPPEKKVLVWITSNALRNALCPKARANAVVLPRSPRLSVELESRFCAVSDRGASSLPLLVVGAKKARRGPPGHHRQLLVLYESSLVRERLDGGNPLIVSPDRRTFADDNSVSELSGSHFVRATC